MDSFSFILSSTFCLQVAGGVNHLVLLTSPSSSPCSISSSLCLPLLLSPSSSTSNKKQPWTSHVWSEEQLPGVLTPRASSLASSPHLPSMRQSQLHMGGNGVTVTAEEEKKKNNSSTPWFANLRTDILTGAFFSPSSSKDHSMFSSQGGDEEEKDRVNMSGETNEKISFGSSHKRSFSASSSCDSGHTTRGDDNGRRFNTFFSFGHLNGESEKHHPSPSVFTSGGAGETGALKNFNSSSSFFSFTKDDDERSSSPHLNNSSSTKTPTTGSALGNWASRFSMSTFFPTANEGKKEAIFPSHERASPPTVATPEKECREGGRENEGMGKKRKTHLVNENSSRTDRSEEERRRVHIAGNGLHQDTPVHAKFLKSLAEGLQARVQGAIEEGLTRAVGGGGEEEQDQADVKTEELKADKLEALLETVDR